ncbi:DNA ligase [Mycobacterium palustre]|nr:DNA ligase [Mycobacterium palustre]MCV7103842.1 DNA ligase [Mycobacterium palustre]
MRLSEYRRRRRRGGDPRFVVRRRAADADHCEFGLEIGGVLVCWALREGSRIARRLADCPLDVAPDDVIVGETGTYTNASPHDMTDGLKRGHLSFRLHGKQVSGGYSLTRVWDGPDETWLLIKRKGDADARREQLPDGDTQDELCGLP